ncbi:hypothetical protein HYU23_04005 [Candidatus Woesearchaeota archaeon]|nr:hypothetical protein [Candidatus Woesearchaeota archaeon]
MKRKLVKQGTATLMISLPSRWIKQNNLDKGNEINLEQIDNNLLISAGLVETKSETTIKLLDLTESSIRTLITNTYRTGYDKIKINFYNEEQFKILKNIINTRLIGFEVIKKEKDYCIVENITEPSADQFDNIINKMFYSISEFMELTRKRFEKLSVNDNYEEIENRIQKYDNFCRRIISKKKLSNKKSELFWNFLALIIHGQREIYHLNKLLDKTILISKETKELLNHTIELFNYIKDGYFKNNIEILSKVHKIEKELIYKKGYSLLQEKKGKENIIIHHLLTAIREFYQSNSPLSGIIL